MKTNYLICTVLLLIFSEGFAQEYKRLRVDGEVRTEKGEELEGIHIYNISAQQGSVTDAQGKFKISVAENDRLQVTSLQYATFVVVVSAEAIAAGKIEIYLNPYVNELEEVLLRNVDLTGHLETDVKNIPVFVVPEIDVSLEAITAYDFERDAQSAVTGNAAKEALGQNSGPLLGIDFIKLAKLAFPKKKKSEFQEFKEPKRVYDILKSRYSVKFFVDNFKIPDTNVDDFIYFVEDNMKDYSLLNVENEMKLIAFLTNLSENYKDRK